MQLWKNYVNSGADWEAIHGECAPHKALTATGLIAACIVGASFATETVGLRHVWVPLVFLMLAGTNTTISWFVGIKRPNLFMALQMLDFTLYSMPFVSSAAFSNSPASLAFAAFYVIILQHWAKTFPFTIVGSLGTLVPALLTAVLLGVQVEVLVLMGLGGAFFLYTSENTRRRLGQEKKTARAGQVLKQIDALLVERQLNSIVDKRVPVAAMFHELKNELGPSLWNLEFILNSSIELPDDERSALGDTRSAMQRILELVERFHQVVSRDEGDSADSNDFWMTDLPEVYSKFGGGLGAGLTFEFGAMPDAKVKGPIEYVVLALHNLVENAYCAGAKKVTISASLSQVTAAVSLVVRDDGPGLPEQVTKRLFEPFNSFEKANGSGLGIYLAKRLIEANDGTLSLGESSDEGTSFDMTLITKGSRAATSSQLAPTH